MSCIGVSLPEHAFVHISASQSERPEASASPQYSTLTPRWWAPHDGIIPGSHLELPYIAPFDHLMDLEACVSLLIYEE